MSKANKQSRGHRLVNAISSKRFFKCVVGLMIVEAAWIALSGRYPMAFDEDFHLGIIKLYAHHIAPFWGGEPKGANVYGAVARDPSYLYQYLISFPYRLISLFTHDQTVQVLWLRAINIALFTSALPLYRRLLQRAGASAAMANSCLLLFVLLPITPLLAAQINYDNLLLPLVALSLLLTLKVDGQLQARRASYPSLLSLVILCLLTSLVKYAFLPIFLVIAIYLAARARHIHGGWKNLRLAKPKDWRQISATKRWILVGLLILSAGLFAQRYAVNVVRYHEPIPDCGQVLSVQQCSAYGPWIRDYNDKIANIGGKHGPLIFTGDWFYGMWLRSFFAVDGPASNFQTRGPLIVPALAAIILPAGALILSLIYNRRLYKGPGSKALVLLTLVSLFYICSLWLDEYRSFVSTGQPVAINGRYLLPILPFLLLIGAKAYSHLLKDSWAKLALLSVATLCMLWGGGALTYILRSNDAWYWPNQTVLDANHAVKHVFGPITPGYHHPTAYLH